MKIAIVGCGALGSYYGAMLCRSGGDVTFLLRSDYAIVRDRGVEIRSIHGDFLAHPRCATLPKQIGTVDLVIVGLKTTANSEFARLLTPLVGPATIVLTLQNGLGNEERLAGLFGPENILGGLCFVCLNRISPGVIQHLGHGQILMGEFQRPPLPRTHGLAALFEASGVPCKIAPNLDQAHWEKLLWNIPFNGLGVGSTAGYEALMGGSVLTKQLGCMSTDRLLDGGRWERLVRELMDEVLRAGRGQGLVIDSSEPELQIERTRIMGAYKASTLIDFERGQPLELEALFLEPLRLAKKAGIATPRLERLCEVLGSLGESP